MDKKNNKTGLLSINLGTVAGIPIRLHWSFLLFLVWIALLELGADRNPFDEITFLIAVFFCVLLHELGHAFMAKQFDVKTKNITLYPIGGVASLTGRTTPAGDLLIAIAGPVVNLVLMVVLAPYTDFVTLLSEVPDERVLVNLSIVERLFIVNTVLFIFNLIPAYPMDGGRIVRAGLSMLWNEERSALISSRLSQILSVMMLVLGLYIGDIFLSVISVIIFISATQENLFYKTKAAVAGRTVKEVMVDVDKLQLFTHGTLIGEACDSCLKSLQDDFPVVLGSDVLGTVSKEEIFKSVAIGDKDNYLSDIMNRELLFARREDELLPLVEKMRSGSHSPILVVEDEKLIGMVPKETLQEFLLVFGLPGYSKRNSKQPLSA